MWVCNCSRPATPTWNNHASNCAVDTCELKPVSNHSRDRAMQISFPTQADCGIFLPNADANLEAQTTKLSVETWAILAKIFVVAAKLGNRRQRHMAQGLARSNVIVYKSVSLRSKCTKTCCDACKPAPGTTRERNVYRIQNFQLTTVAKVNSS